MSAVVLALLAIIFWLLVAALICLAIGKGASRVDALETQGRRRLGIDQEDAATKRRSAASVGSRSHRELRS